jgi:hypothetical protein
MPLDEEQPVPLPEGRIGREMEQIPYEQLLPVEKKLIAVSLILGVVLLGVLVWVSYTFFPAP